MGFDETSETKLGQPDVERTKESGLWVGPDLKIDHDLLVEPGGDFTDQVITEERGMLLHRMLKGQLFHSVRSTLAQLGLEISVMGRAWEQMDEANLSGTDQTVVPIEVKNWGLSPVQLRAGDGLFRFFSQESPHRLEGRELQDHIVGLGVISGSYGSDWWFIDAQGQKLTQENTDKAAIICLAFNPDSRLWLPPSGKPLRASHRSELEAQLRPMPKEKETNFFVTETTARLKMSGKPAVLFSGFKPGFELNPNTYRQTQSTFIDQDFGRAGAGKKIRLEIVDPKHEARQKPFVYAEFL